MQTVALEKAQASLPDLLRQVAGGEEFTITQNGEPKAKLSAVAPQEVSSYLKNGILVHHTGQKINPEEIEKALAEE
ncbi:MAG: type II toxin-antitoxin system prevent-host-death family antitoxin [Verrucomicrobiota bacterium]|nr:type II toxin-antitoxin system prevent-host-death family antitoxin [Verrucomicrobiota bacterium]